MPTIAFITTCKGRLDHLRKTLPLMVAQQPDEIVVVDYSCPDGAGDWVETNHPDVKVVRVAESGDFAMCRARNIGARHTNAQWLVFIDADIVIEAGWVQWMRESLRPGLFYRCAPVDGARDFETFGTAICDRTGFDTAGGFDEVLTGWSGGDFDFYRCLADHGIQEREYPAAFVKAIPHGDERRAGFDGLKSRDERMVLSLCYTQAKRFFIKMQDSKEPLPFEQRIQIFSTLRDQLKSWQDSGAEGPMTATFAQDHGSRWASEVYSVGSEFSVTFRVEQGHTQIKL